MAIDVRASTIRCAQRQRKRGNAPSLSNVSAQTTGGYQNRKSARRTERSTDLRTAVSRFEMAEMGKALKKVEKSPKSGRPANRTQNEKTKKV